jgi:hypothetical protein
MPARVLTFCNAVLDFEADLQKIVDAEFDDFGAKAKGERRARADLIPLRQEDAAAVAPPALSDEEDAVVSAAATFLRGRENAGALVEIILARVQEKHAEDVAEPGAQPEGGENA